MTQNPGNGVKDDERKFQNSGTAQEYIVAVPKNESVSTAEVKIISNRSYFYK